MNEINLALTPEQAAIANALADALHCSVEDVIKSILRDFAETNRWALIVGPEGLGSWVFPALRRPQ